MIDTGVHNDIFVNEYITTIYCAGIGSPVDRVHNDRYLLTEYMMTDTC